MAYKIVGCWEDFCGERLRCYRVFVIDRDNDFDTWRFFEKVIVKKEIS
jgi:hypothetical protein